MLTLFYSPHAQSVDNQTGRASGHADVPLTQFGREAARELGRHYLDKTVDRVFCSDLQRASETAEIAFAQRGFPIIRDFRLRECDYGEMTQFPASQVDDAFRMHILDPFPGGESVRMVVERVGTLLAELLARHDGESVVVIAHRATKHAIDYWSGDASLEQVVGERWEWREIPIWRYEIDRRNLDRAGGLAY